MIKHTQFPEGNHLRIENHTKHGTASLGLPPLLWNRPFKLIWSPTSCHSKPGKSNRESTTLETEIDTVNYFEKKRIKTGHNKTGGSWQRKPFIVTCLSCPWSTGEFEVKRLQGLRRHQAFSQVFHHQFGLWWGNLGPKKTPSRYEANQGIREHHEISG